MQQSVGEALKQKGCHLFGFGHLSFMEGFGLGRGDLRCWFVQMCTSFLGSSEHYGGDQNGEKGQIRGVGQNLSRKCQNGRCAFDLANKMPSALLIVLGPAFTVKNSQYLINDA